MNLERVFSRNESHVFLDEYSQMNSSSILHLPDIKEKERSTSRLRHHLAMLTAECFEYDMSATKLQV